MDLADRRNYYSYILLQEENDWSEELRYPLLQQYLSERIIECKPADLKVGIYCLATNQFDFKTYTGDEIEGVINETTGVFSKVYNEYIKHKK